MVPCTLEDVPLLEDVNVMCQLLEHFGTCLKWNNKILYLDNSQIKPAPAPYDLVRKMRASFLVMGPILTRFGNVKISLPGGVLLEPGRLTCILKDLLPWGRILHLGHGYIEAHAKNWLVIKYTGLSKCGGN
jgi:UDP-N-acetylglucosamine 1-carboxyvinyltransferase